MTLTPEREQEIRARTGRATSPWECLSPDSELRQAGAMCRDLLAEVDALRAAGDKLADRLEFWAGDKDSALAGWREARRD